MTGTGDNVRVREGGSGGAIDASPDRKRAFRAAVRTERDGMSEGERAAVDAAIAAQVIAHPAFREAPVVLSYLSFGSEVETRPVLEAAWAAGKTVAIPRCAKALACDGVEIPLLAWYAVDSLEDLVPGAFGILEPDSASGHPLDVTGLDGDALALVPGLAFDRAGYRVGYGGGYYDRFLPDFPGVSLGLCRSRFLEDDLRADGLVEPHDLPVDLIVTESEFLSAT